MQRQARRRAALRAFSSACQACRHASIGFSPFRSTSQQGWLFSLKVGERFIPSATSHLWFDPRPDYLISGGMSKAAQATTSAARF
jgi:hypothetical protein